MKAMRIALTEFAKRHWDESSSGTKIIGLSPDDFVALCNTALDAGSPLVAGYAPFCKHFFVENTTPTKSAFAPITDENRHLLRSGYAARREGELAVLERWFEGLAPPRAAFLDVILYSKAQLEAEAAEGPDSAPPPDCEWGIV